MLFSTPHWARARSLRGPDGGFNAHRVKEALATVPGLRMEIVKWFDDIKGFVVPLRRWVAQRTFSWFGQNRRLAEDYENPADAVAAFVALAAIHLGLKRPARA